MRGKDKPGPVKLAASWIIPACAGKSQFLPTAFHRAQDHPRVCGEKCPPGKFFFMTVGSPPRMRGKVVDYRAEYTAVGITPACAGKSQSSPGWWSRQWDHPRACGEKFLACKAAMSLSGSPPRMRGKDTGCFVHHEKHRITPACAGKRTGKDSWSCGIGDHPRVCGEKSHPASDRKLGRVRGTKRSSGPAPAAAPAGLAGSCPASPPWSYPPRITVSRPRP